MREKRKIRLELRPNYNLGDVKKLQKNTVFIFRPLKFKAWKMEHMHF